MSPPDLPDAAERTLGPRERRRTRTMREIQSEAFRLFAEQGYDQTTTEQIADAADISPRTFFRYFPTKEDVVVWDEYDAVIGDRLAARPSDEPLGETMRAVTREALSALHEHDPARLLARHRLLSTVPAVRARFLEFARSGVDQFNALYAEARNLPPDDLRLRLTAFAMVDAAGVACDLWQASHGKRDLIGLYDEATDALIDGIAELRRSDDLDG